MISFYYFASDGKSHADATTHGIGVQRTERNAFGYVNFHLISKLNQINEFLGSRSGGITRNGAHNTATLDTDAKNKSIIEYKRGIREMADSCSSSFRRKCKWQNNTWTFQVREKNKSRVELCKRPFSFFLSSRRESIDYTLQQPTQREQVPRGRCNLLLLRRVLNRKTQQIFFNVFTGLAVTVSLRRERNSKAGVTHISLFLLRLLLLTKKEARGMCFGWDEKMVMGRRCINNNSNRPPSWCSSYTFRSVIIGQKAQWKFLFFLHLTLNAFSSAPSATGCLPDIGIDRQTIV